MRAEDLGALENMLEEPERALGNVMANISASCLHLELLSNRQSQRTVKNAPS